MPATEGGDGQSRDDRLEHAIALLDQALGMIDELDEHPEIGARLHGLIEDLRKDSA